MSYNNDEQARRSQAAQNNQWASNSSQPQNLAPYQTGSYSNPNEPIVHTSQTVPMTLLNSPSSHSRPVLPYDPTVQSPAGHDPSRRESLLRTTLVRAAYDQGEPSREPLGVGFSAQPSNYYAQAPPYPGPGPSGSQTAQINPGGPSSNLALNKVPKYNKKSYEKRRDKKASEGICLSCDEPVSEGHKSCESCLEDQRKRHQRERQEAIDRGDCYRCQKTPALYHGGRCQVCTDKCRV